MYYRPRKPPLVTADDLASVVAELSKTSKLTTSGMYGLKVKFGEAIDRDDKETIWYEQTAPGVARVHEIEWDIELSRAKGMDDIQMALAGDSRTIYRANVFLGMPTNDVLAPVTRMNSPENEIHYLPDTLALQIGPINAGLLSSDECVQVGWIALSLSGSGYLYPWTLADALERAATSQPIQVLTDIMRARWPVPPAVPDPEITELRRQLPDVWPHSDVDRKWDWYWGALET
jgi:hypothetical protein